MKFLPGDKVKVLGAGSKWLMSTIGYEMVVTSTNGTNVWCKQAKTGKSHFNMCYGPYAAYQLKLLTKCDKTRIS